MREAAHITPQMIEAAACAIREQFGSNFDSRIRMRRWDALPETLRDGYRAGGRP